jgi:hydroxymethylpyrimidine pyrophosphatase-like HAD family hydrolase
VIPRIIASDLDGTLLHSDGTLGERTRRALAAAAAAGIQIVLCTARPPRWMAPLARALDHDGLAVCANGAVIWDLAASAEVESFPIAPGAARAVVDELRRALPHAAWALERVDRFGHEPGYEPHWPVPEDTIVAAIDDLLGEPPVKLMLRDPELSADALLGRARELVGHLVECSHSSSHDTLLEMSAAGVSKASSLQRLCDRAGVPAGAVMAFGDMPNDLPMLQWAGIGIAVANAHPAVLEAADEVTAANDADGVGVRLEAVLERVHAPAGGGVRGA